jgi:uncharacterized membrane protein YbhN (UPF0104 family)
MKVRRLLLFLASAVIAVTLIVLLIRLGKVDLRLTLHQLELVSVFDFFKLVLLNGLLVYLSTEKWRSIDFAMRRPSDFVPSRIASFLVSSAGMALGLLIPVQFVMTIARTIATNTYGGALKRGTAGTLFEQGFDLIVVAFLSIASAVTWLCRGGGIMWYVCAVVMTAIALLVVGPTIRMTEWFCRCASGNVIYESSCWRPHWLDELVMRVLRSVSELHHSGFVNARLARRLVVLSAARFAVVVLMAVQTAKAIGASIPLWHMAAAIPFVSIANVIGITPGGIGVNELTSVTALHLFGTSLDVASQWALANRLLGTGSCFTVAACAFIVLGASKIISSCWLVMIQNHQ